MGKSTEPLKTRQYVTAETLTLEQNLTSVCSLHFHGQKYGTAKNASIRNRKKHKYATAETLTSEGNCGAPGAL